MTDVDDFWGRVDPNGPIPAHRPELGPCWLWTGDRWGFYGSFRTTSNGDRALAHRVAYELVIGPIPDGLQLDHLCWTRLCVRPSHTEPVTPRVNTMRSTSPSALNALKQACPVGHPYTTDRNRRRCLVCQGIAQQAHRRARGAKPQKRFTDDQVLAIRDRAARGERQADLCREFGVSAPCMSELVNRKKYAGVEAAA